MTGWETSPPAPPGWHPDPSGLPTLRWWDGFRWTEQLAPFSPPRAVNATPDDVQHRTNGMAIASFVLGLLWVGGVGAILAIVFGEIARHQIKNSGHAQSGAGLAMAGRILGALGVVLPLTILIINASSHS